MIHLHNQRKAECQAKTLAVAYVATTPMSAVVADHGRARATPESGACGGLRHIVNEKKLLEADAHLLTLQAELDVPSSTSEQEMKTEASLVLAFTAKSQSTSVKRKTLEYAKILAELKVVEASKLFVQNVGYGPP